HWRDSLPMQNRLPGEHTPVTQVAATQIWALAAQSSVTVCESPSAAHLTTCVPDCVHPVTEGVHTLSLQTADEPIATQTCVLHGAGEAKPLPSARHVTMELA